jgi:two-component system chemotaxis sensor kinase CheA
MDELLGDFLSETAENLAAVDADLLRWEKAPGDRALLDRIFRVVHTIKGTCGFIELPRMEALTHAAETALGRVREGRLAVSPSLVSAVLASLDAVRGMLAVLEATQKEADGDDAALIARLRAVADGEAVDVVEADEIETAAVGGQTVRVSVTLLDALMTTVSELVLTRNQMREIARADSGLDRFGGPMQRLSQCVAELQDGVMRTRMQPIAGAWAGLPRLLRGLNRDLGKQIELETTGGETELDRQLLERVKDPLAHMLRNAADHGIEAPEARIAAGKPMTGRIRLSAAQEGGHAVVTMRDDGRGIDLVRLRARAVERGIAEAAAMSDAQAARLIFHAGLSTAEAVTQVSGRGVGMDVVKANIEAIGGTVEIETAAGAGTCFTLRIPLTLAIMPALLVGAGAQRIAVPQIAVRELVQVGDDSEHRIERVHDAAVLRLRGRMLPLVDLCALLDVETDAEGQGYVVVVESGSRSFGLTVGELFDTEEIVVKPLARMLAASGLWSGNAILGDGAAVLILDVNGLAQQTELALVEAVDEAPPEMAGDRDTMLVFEAGSGAPKAVPLAVVARIENIEVVEIEWSEGRPVVQYRGGMMPLLTVEAGQELKAAGRQPVVVFCDNGRFVGLAVDRVADIVEDVIEISLSADVGGRLGSAIIAGRVTEIVDVGHYLTAGLKRVLHPGGAPEKAKAAVLIVDDSAFFRNMLQPLLGAAGYAVTTAASAEDALRLRDAGARFDLILSDIEMPGLSGVEFARVVRGTGDWAEVPMVALSSLASAAHSERGRAAGFDEYVPKFDRLSLLSVLERQLEKAA